METLYRANVLVCGGTGCEASGSANVFEAMTSELLQPDDEEEFDVRALFERYIRAIIGHFLDEREGFMLMIKVGYPTKAEEREIMDRMTSPVVVSVISERTLATRSR